MLGFSHHSVEMDLFMWNETLKIPKEVMLVIRPHAVLWTRLVPKYFSILELEKVYWKKVIVFNC